MQRRSREGAGIEIMCAMLVAVRSSVAPARERGLKWLRAHNGLPIRCRSREGAGIEIWFYVPERLVFAVASARERGLK